MGFQLLKPEDQEWDILFEKIPESNKDVFYTSCFAKLYQTAINSNDQIICASYTSSTGGVLLYPFVQRNISKAKNIQNNADLFDTISLYGRGGVVGRATNEEISIFYTKLTSYFRDNNVFCSFDRFHPLINNHEYAPPGCRLLNVGGFVVVDISQSISDLELSFKPSVRKDIRKAQRNNVICFSESNTNHLSDFMQIYYSTMDRKSASNFYYFSDRFFSQLPKFMGKNFEFFYAVHDGKIISCELVLHYGSYSHSFLGGTLKDYLPLAANPILKLNIFHRMKELKCNYFLLGGGVTPNDGIFKFKNSYAPNGVLKSYVGGTIWDESAYFALKNYMLSNQLPVIDNRFQFYDV